MEGKDIFTHDEALSHARFHVRTLADLLCEYFTVDPVYDFGCGDGWYLHKIQCARSEDGRPLPRCVGFEGTADLTGIAIHDNIIHPVDVGQQIIVPQRGSVMSIEVGEHLPEAKIGPYVDNLVRACAHKLVVTWAVRGQGGRRHISCRNADEVVPMFERRGFVYMSKTSMVWRNAILAQEEKRFHYLGNTIYLFERK